MLSAGPPTTAAPRGTPLLRAAIARAGPLDAPRVRAVLARFEDLAALVRSSPGELARIGVARGIAHRLTAPDHALIEGDLEWLSRSGATLLCAGDAHYPPALESIPDAPGALYVLGDVRLLGEPQIAIVGSRAASPAGREIAHRFAGDLATWGLAVTSGLAAGVDAAAHLGALAAGGVSIAVSATGLDRVYPQRHRDLAASLERQGALVSEFAPGAPPRREHFPRRNRIISGLSLGVLVVEAAPRSGSLITARLAAEQGREVFAIPGSIHDRRKRGCHRLIRLGAALVEEPWEILAELAPQLAPHLAPGPAVQGAPGARSRDGPAPEPGEPCPDTRTVLAALGYDAVTIDVLVGRTGLTAQVVSSILMRLEVRGSVAREPGAMFVRLANPGAGRPGVP